MELTEKERNLILSLRKEQEKKHSDTSYRLHILDIAHQYAKWLEENGAGDTYSTFCDDFGYEGWQKTSRPQTHKNVMSIIHHTYSL